jgi:hypothetical protein
MGCFLTADLSRLGDGTDPIQVTAGGDPGVASLLSWPRYHTVMVMEP